MAWPQSHDYNEAVQDPTLCFADADLQKAEAVCTALGLPQARSGNFADVYQLRAADAKTSWAVKCFTKPVRGLQERYREISRHLRSAGLPSPGHLHRPAQFGAAGAQLLGAVQQRR